MKKLQEEYIFLKPVDKDLSLILRDGNNIIFSSKKRGLRPLVECVSKYADTVSDAFLADRVVGSAAARLIIRSGMISTVKAGVISESALKLLSDHSILVEWREITNVILRSDGQGSCPMEELSRSFPEDQDFFPAIFHHFSISAGNKPWLKE